MSKGDLLRAIYDDKNATWYVDSDHRIASRRFTTDSRGNVTVEYLDRDGKRIASAREVRSYGKHPQVEFLDRDGQVKGHAYLDVNGIGDPNVSYYNYVGDKVGEKFFDKSRLDGILEDYNRDTGKMKKEPEKKAQTVTATQTTYVRRHTSDGGGIDVSGAGAAIAGITLVGVFIGMIANLFFSTLNTYMDEILHYGGILCVFASCPMMLLLQLILCRVPKHSSSQVRRFRRGHMILSTLAFAALALCQSVLYYLECFPAIAPRFFDGSMFGLYHFLSCFVPMMVYGLISGIWTIAVKHKADADICIGFSFDSMELVMYGSCTLITVTQVLELAMGYAPSNFGMVIIYILAVPFLALLIFLAMFIACLPFRILSKAF